MPKRSQQLEIPVGQQASEPLLEAIHSKVQKLVVAGEMAVRVSNSIEFTLGKTSFLLLLTVHGSSAKLFVGGHERWFDLANPKGPNDCVNEAIRAAGFLLKSHRREWHAMRVMGWDGAI